ncbi:MAG TPA: Na+/H+ antiporter NhaA [Sphingobacteriaceae bacterium]|nr:Na+/H+ antiporter NhaA [Sphingobacteriaceae bacterium]
MAVSINFQLFKNFLRSQQIGGAILLLCVVVSLIIANSPIGSDFQNLLEKELGFETSAIHLQYPIGLWINDGLMALFFLMVGLEIKRELVEGELSSPKRAALPIFAALGGMLIPALAYVFFNNGLETGKGWGIPMATDIAFALAIISMLGKKVPVSLKIFLAALAIVDDLGAILIIALFYTNELHVNPLLYAAGIFGMLLLFNRFGVKKLIFYLIPGIFLWYFVHLSGIHATIAGVLLAFTVPTNPVKEISPLEKLEHGLVAPVNYFIMPLFALANTNIRFESTMLEGLYSPLGLGIITGLFLGKPVGVVLFSFISVKLGLSKLPSHSTWKHILGLGFLAGIGFTMSIFISLLSFSNPQFTAEAKFSILVGSVISGLAGFIILNNLSKKNKPV